MFLVHTARVMNMGVDLSDIIKVAGKLDEVQ